MCRLLGELTEYDQQVLDELALFPDRIGQSIGQYRFREALGYLMDLARLGNKYLAETEPWKVDQNGPAAGKNHPEYCAPDFGQPQHRLRTLSALYGREIA